MVMDDASRDDAVSGVRVLGASRCRTWGQTVSPRCCTQLGLTSAQRKDFDAFVSAIPCVSLEAVCETEVRERARLTGTRWLTGLCRARRAATCWRATSQHATCTSAWSGWRRQVPLLRCALLSCVCGLRSAHGRVGPHPFLPCGKRGGVVGPARRRVE